MGSVAILEKPEGVQKFQVSLVSWSALIPGQIEYDPLVGKESDKAPVGIGLYQVKADSSNYYLAVYPGEEGVQQLVMTEAEAMAYLDEIRATASRLKIEILILQKIWSYEFSQLALETANSDGAISSPGNLNPFPWLQAAVKRGYSLEQIGCIMEMAKLIRLDTGWEPRKRPAHPQGETRAPVGQIHVEWIEGRYVIEISVFDRHNEHIDAIRATCHAHKAFALAWNGTRCCWQCEHDVVPFLEKICRFKRSPAYQKHLKEGRIEAKVTATYLVNRLEKLQFDKTCQPKLQIALHDFKKSGQTIPDMQDLLGIEAYYERFGELKPFMQVRLLQVLRQAEGLDLPTDIELQDHFNLCGQKVIAAYLYCRDDGKGSYLQVRTTLQNESLQERLNNIALRLPCPGVLPVDKPNRCWNFGLQGFNQVLELGYNYELSDELKALLKGEIELESLNPLTPQSMHREAIARNQWTIRMAPDGSTIELRVPPQQEVLDLIRQLGWIDFNGKTDDKYWQFPPSQALVLVEKLGDQFNIDAEVSRLARQQQALIDQQEGIDRQQIVDYRDRLLKGCKLDEPLGNGWRLRPNQIEAITAICYSITDRRDKPYPFLGYILGLDMGLGKTLCSLVVANAIMQTQRDLDLTLYIIAPICLRDSWQSHMDSLGMDGEIFGYGKMPKPKPTQKYLIIFDEAQALTEMKTQRTRRAIALSTHPNCLMAMPMISTPLDNGMPKELFGMLRICRHPLSESQRKYESRYCNAHATEFNKWDTNGSSNLDELRLRLQDVILIQRNADRLDLPPRTRLFTPVSLSTSEVKLLESKVAQIKLNYLERIQQGNVGNMALVYLGLFRQANSIAKVSAACEIARHYASNKQAVVIGTEFIETAKALHNELGGIVITGNTEIKERSRLEEKFRSGNDKFLIAAQGAVGTGLILPRAAVTISIDRPLDSGKISQFEDRIYRVGQNKPTTSIWLQNGVIDHEIDCLLFQKEHIADLILMGDFNPIETTVKIGNQEADAILQKIFDLS